MKANADGSMPRMDELLHTKPTCGKPNQDLVEQLASAGKPAESSSCATMDPDADGPLGAIEMWCGVDRSMMTWLGDPKVVAALHMQGPKGTEQNNLRCLLPTHCLQPSLAFVADTNRPTGLFAFCCVRGRECGYAEYVSILGM